MLDLVTIKGAINAVKIAANLADKAGKIPEYNQILNLQSLLLEVQGEMFEKQKRIEDLERENEDLKRKFHTAKKMQVRGNAYYDEDDGPFCTTCWDVKQMKIRLTPTYLGSPYATCNACRPNTSIQIKPDNPSPYIEPDNFDPYSVV